MKSVMRIALIGAALTTLALALISSARAGGSDDPQLAGAESFAFGIGNGMLSGNSDAIARRLGDYDVVVIDGEEASWRAEMSRGEVALYVRVPAAATSRSCRRWLGDVREPLVPACGLAGLEGASTASSSTTWT
jgi:hypothetical protein